MAADTTDEGAIPMKKPRVTAIVAMMTLPEGVERVYTDDTSIVSGSCSPRAI